MYCFDQAKTQLSYKTKPNMCVILLSTFHEKPYVNKESKKPEIIEFDNSTKGAVDTLDQMCSNMSCSRKTRRWSLCVFYDIINISLVNSHVLYGHNMTRKSEKVMSRKKFAVKLSEDLLAPWMKKRLDAPALPRSTRIIISELLKIDMVCEIPKTNESNKRKICAFCPYKLRRMTRFFLSKLYKSNVRRSPC
ncbi:piggyBac transposable element-derived protein 4-like [Argiope bruennichi]|uniref:piggyBac transposable element-derived protein 4-like n=1 Tax=Argiope bruennichi TaxID=94029 RepID=UPI002494BE6A|nr:piggyBac transposable element-derived protein 4-like [Argiope bruennichi]